MTNHRTPVAPSTISLRVVLLDHHRVLRLGAALILLNACLAGWSQSIWQPRPVPRCPGMQRLLVDTLSDRIYFYGVNGLSVNEPCGPFGGDVYAWDHYQWDSITYIAGTPRAMIVYHDTLIMGGGFADFEENGTVAYVNGAWIPYGSLNYGVMNLEIIEDTLWAVGSFTLADGQAAKGVAKRVGGQWLPVGTMPENEPLMFDIAKYNGDLIIAGSSYMVNGHSSLYHLVDGVWELLGDALVGLVSQASRFVDYQGRLYIGGSIRQADGNVGHGIIAWDGTNYHNVGGGLYWSPNDTYTLTGLRSMVVHNGLLYVGGGFNYAGTLESRGIAAWDGTGWCAVNGNLMVTGGDYVEDMAFWGDSLFVGCGRNIDDIQVGNGACALTSAVLGPCQYVGISSSGSESAQILITPNPALDQVSIAIGQGVIDRYRLFSASGSEMMAGSPLSDRLVLERSGIPAGIYWVELTTSFGVFVRKVVFE